MNGRYLLDTNIVIALFEEDEVVLKKISEAREIYHSSIVIGELYYGAFNSTKKAENLRKVDDYRDESTILNTDEQIAKLYGKVKSQLKKKGNPIPENDIWIAATAIQCDLTLVSRDKHFDNISGLSLEKW